MQYPHPGPAAAAPAVGVPLYAPTPLLQPAHPTPFYIEDILGRGPTAPTPTPTLPSPNSSFTSLVSSYRTPVYEPTPIHPAFSHPSAAALAAAYGPGGFGGPLYPFPRTVNDYTHALLRHDPLGKAAGSRRGQARAESDAGSTRQVAAPGRRRGRRGAAIESCGQSYWKVVLGRAGGRRARARAARCERRPHGDSDWFSCTLQASGRTDPGETSSAATGGWRWRAAPTRGSRGGASLAKCRGARGGAVSRRPRSAPAAQS